ncbi:NAD(P)H-dependent oxidoreductase [Algoriphagus vanfongensis]|uniref:NAD(P)H-dependent oxidoreductase n=1 Tax=Algoriphagus vanfongensis TaxID=426371 RepID=UPI0003FF4BE1|nr:NAD(P)H-dependent oxidoreductase [Algoriphagus vanfongensis]
MTKAEILIVNGHPDKESYNAALSEAYRQGAEQSNANVSVIHLRDLDFNLNLEFGYRKRSDLEPDLVTAIEQVKRANHIVWVFPMWWYGYPALMKGFVERTFLPGIFFEFEKGKSLPKKLLKGKTARIIVTADTPKWYDTLFMRSPAINQFRKGTLQFCGINPVKVSYIGPIKSSSDEFRAKWLSRVHRLGMSNK